jgi:hypothetical protein
MNLEVEKAAMSVLPRLSDGTCISPRYVVDPSYRERWRKWMEETPRERWPGWLVIDDLVMRGKRP